jgi:hypothetical protein
VLPGGSDPDPGSVQGAADGFLVHTEVFGYPDQGQSVVLVASDGFHHLLIGELEELGAMLNTSPAEVLQHRGTMDLEVLDELRDASW